MSSFSTFTLLLRQQKVIWPIKTTDAAMWSLLTAVTPEDKGREKVYFVTIPNNTIMLYR